MLLKSLEIRLFYRKLKSRKPQEVYSTEILLNTQRSEIDLPEIDSNFRAREGTGLSAMTAPSWGQPSKPGAYNNELHFHITDEGLSISRNVWLELNKKSVANHFYRTQEQTQLSQLQNTQLNLLS